MTMKRSEVRPSDPFMARVLVVVAPALVIFTWFSMANAQVVRYPWVLVEFRTDQNGNAQPIVISPEGKILVDGSGKILDPRAGTVNSFTQTSGIQEAIN